MEGLWLALSVKSWSGAPWSRWSQMWTWALQTRLQWAFLTCLSCARRRSPSVNPRLKVHDTWQASTIHGDSSQSEREGGLDSEEHPRGSVE